MGDVKEFLTFRRMMTPILIQIIFWVGLVGIIIVSITMIAGVSTMRMPSEIQGGRQAGVVLGIVFLIFGPLYWRVLCETLIVVFRMNENLDKIEKNTQKPPATTGDVG